MSDFVQQGASTIEFNTCDSWVVLTPIELSIKRKIESVGVPLKDWDIQINYGIKTGFNDAFIVSTDIRNQILANCKDDEERRRTEELIRPILRGRDIKRYGYEWANLWLINTHNGIKGKLDRIHIEDYPAIKAHLDQYWDKISTRADKGDTPYNLRNCAYLDDFSKPKIAWGNLNLSASFSFVEDGFFLNAPCPMIVPGTPYLLKMLNSDVVDYCIRNLGVTRNGGYFEYKPMFVSQAMIPFRESLSTNLYTKILSESDENVINELVAKAFNLSDEEYEFIKSKLKAKYK
ncbi:MAG: class I SAM-dependent DNA methyltransferase [Bacteroides sp.]|nr:class I SAM-dependent DNA methyltransferase [Bacteroides sp.]